MYMRYLYIFKKSKNIQIFYSNTQALYVTLQSFKSEFGLDPPHCSTQFNSSCSCSSCLAAFIISISASCVVSLPSL